MIRIICTLAAISIATLGSVFVTDTCAADKSATPMSVERETAQIAMRDLGQLVNQENFRLLGFSSLEEAKSATLGARVTKRIIGYDRLLAYQSGTAISALFAPAELVLYPVQVAGITRCVILLSRRDNKWAISSIGDSYLGQALSDAQVLQPAGSTVSVISIPGLNLDFVAFQQGSTVTLFPALDYPETGLQRLKAIDSAQLMPIVATYARDFEQRYGEQIRSRRLTN